MFDNDLLQLLACPACHHSLKPQGSAHNPEGLCCPKCSIVYPINGSIPIMLKEEAILLADWQNGKRKK